MNIMPFILSMQATNLSFSGAGNAMAADQERMDMADSVSGNESPAELVDIAARDKALSMASAKSWIDFEVAQGLRNRANDMHKKDLEQQRRLMDQDGVIFF